MTLSMMQEMGLYDEHGRCRCPGCGRFRKRSDIPDQQGHFEFGSGPIRGHIHVAPLCFKCLGEDEP